MVVLQGQVKRMSAILLPPKCEGTTWEKARNWKAIVHLHSHEVLQLEGKRDTQAPRAHGSWVASCQTGEKSKAMCHDPHCAWKKPAFTERLLHAGLSYPLPFEFPLPPCEEGNVFMPILLKRRQMSREIGNLPRSHVFPTSGFQEGLSLNTLWSLLSLPMATE